MGWTKEKAVSGQVGGVKSSRMVIAVGGQAKENMGGEKQEKSGEGSDFLGRESLY